MLGSKNGDDRLKFRADLMWDPEEGLKENVEITISDDQIVDVEVNKRNTKSSPDKNLVDLGKVTLMPGLIDSHVHLGIDAARMQDCLTRDSSPLIGFRAANDAIRCLKSGFTTLRVMEGRGYYAVALRKAISDGLVDGPRIFSSGRYIQGTGGHANMFVPAPENKIDFGAEDVNGPNEARKAAREQIYRGAKFLKVVVTGGVLSASDKSTTLQTREDEIRAVVDEVSAADITVAAHAHSFQGVEVAAKAGVTSIEHATFARKDDLQIMKDNGVFLVPTFLVSEEIMQRAKSGELGEHALRKSKEAEGSSSRVFENARSMGVKIAMGTDLCFHDKFGTNAKELELMVEKGMREEEALQSATKNAAQCLGIYDKIGSIKPGKKADLIATHKNPLEDIKEAQNVIFVMKDGDIISQSIDDANKN